jgi:bifunctional non-homologous end joining protein LigD
VVLLDGGVPSFGALTDRMHEPVDPRGALARPVTYMVFDVLRLYGVTLLERPFDERRATLERLDLPVVVNLSLSPGYTDGEALLDVTRQRGLEGVLAKRRTSTYRPGVRTPEWVSAAHHPSRAAVVGGWRPEPGSGGRVAALLVGVPAPAGLRFVGTVDVGQVGATMQRVLHGRMTATLLEPSPFTEGMSRAAAAGARWCVPSTVVELAHDGWGAGRLRNPVFRGVRDDLRAADISPDIPPEE